MNPATILIVDDEPQIRRVLRTTLSSEGYAVVEARDGQEALEKLRAERPGLVLLDVNMPVLDGLEACRQIRATSRVPVIMLTVRGAEKDKVRVLDAGADDYVVKPFGIQDLNVDFAKRVTMVRGRAVHLTPKEFDVLRELVAHRDTPISHRRLLQAVWGPDYGDETEYLRVVINQLRKKIEADPANPKYILTEPWVGYRLVLPSDARIKTISAET
jgi:two-component system, OmpR family, KDP operon response regulator KdpE